MLQIVLIRPGSTDYDRQGRIQGTLDVPLSEEGLQQVSQTIEPLRSQGIQAVYASPGEASAQTGQTIAQALGVKLKTLDSLHNLDHGLWQGMLKHDVKTKQPKVYRQWQEHPENICPPGGEMLNAARERVQQAIARLAKKHKEGVVGLVVPEPLASVVHSLVCDDALGDLWKPAACGSWEFLSVTPKATAASN